MVFISIDTKETFDLKKYFKIIKQEIDEKPNFALIYLVL